MFWMKMVNFLGNKLNIRDPREILNLKTIAINN